MTMCKVTWLMMNENGKVSVPPKLRARPRRFWHTHSSWCGRSWSRWHLWSCFLPIRPSPGSIHMSPRFVGL